MNLSLSVERIKSWGIKGGLGVLDQALYSGSNFLLSILLARWISPEMYGGFSAAYSLFLLISNVQVALIAEPMSILGANTYQGKVISYLNYLLRMQWIGSLFFVFLLLGTSFFFTNHILRDALIAMAISLPFIFFHWYLRRALYIEMQSGQAMLTSLIYSGLLILLMLLSYIWGYITPFIAFFVMALGSLAASFFALKQLRVHFWGKDAVEAELDSQIVRQELWKFGQWILPAYLAGWFTTLSFPFFITILIDIPSAGAFRALQNLFLPFQQLLASITLIALPWLARKNDDRIPDKVFVATETVAGITGVAALLYCFLIVFFRHQIIAFLYAKEFYSAFDALVIVLAISTLLGSVPLILGLALRILGHPSVILWSKGCAAFFTLLVGLPMILIYQMNGVIFSLLGGICIEAIILILFYVSIRRTSRIAKLFSIK